MLLDDEELKEIEVASQRLQLLEKQKKSKNNYKYGDSETVGSYFAGSLSDSRNQPNLDQVENIKGIGKDE